MKAFRAGNRQTTFFHLYTQYGIFLESSSLSLLPSVTEKKKTQTPKSNKLYSNLHHQNYLEKALKEKQMETDSIGEKTEDWIALCG